MTDVLIINGHPRSESYCQALAQSYGDAARNKGKTVEILHVHALAFDPHQMQDLTTGHINLEPDLLQAQAAIAAAKHLVWVYPNWWGNMPALLKGFIDRTFTPGFAYKFHKGNPLPEQLLKGKTAELIISMDGPAWWFRGPMGNGGTKAMVRSTLAFCGIKTTRVYMADKLRAHGPALATRHLEKVRKMGLRQGA